MGTPLLHCDVCSFAAIVNDPFSNMTIQRPMHVAPVRVLLEQAGQDVSDWAFTKDGDTIKNPNDNISRNTSWSFIGKEGEPAVLCVWYDEINQEGETPVFVGNGRRYRQSLLDLDTGERESDVRGRLRTWTRRSADFDEVVQTCLKRRSRVRLIMVDGPRRDSRSALEAAEVSARSLDTEDWYVHSFADQTGEYRIVRGIVPPVAVVKDAELTPDVAADLGLQAFLGTLQETERAAIIKARVGQGPFRDALIARWKGCSVTGLAKTEFCIASHIKPWRDCESAAERVSAANGLLLIPNLDVLFDSGYISFDDRFRIMISPQLKDGFLSMLNVTRHMRLRAAAAEDNQTFLDWHRARVFKG